MKRWFISIVLLLCLMTAGTACAETYVFSDPQNSCAVYTCEDFEGEMPVSAQMAFVSVLREGDEILCGTIIEETFEGYTGLQAGSAMLALRREGQLLLIGAAYTETWGWRAGVESDCFLPQDADFSMTAMPDYTISGMLRFVTLALVCGNERLHIRSDSDGSLNLWEYIRDEEDGTKIICAYKDGHADWKTQTLGKKDTIYGDAGPLPSRLCAWTFDTLPRSLEESRIWTAPMPLDVAADEGFLSGVNLREKPTGKSKSLGIYRAKAQILGQKPGAEVPWYNVRVGNLTGWASGIYVKTESVEGVYDLAAYQMQVKKVGRGKSAVQLLDGPDGDPVAVLASGTLVHALVENDGWLHVIVPRGELSWQTDWNGTYGFVKAKDMLVGISEADVAWR